MSTPAAAASAEQVALTQQPPAADAAAVTDVQVDVTTTTEPAAAGAADKQAGGGGGILTSAAGTNQGAFGAVEWALFTSVGCIWGSSFLFMAIGLEAFEPGVITWLRVSSGALVLALVPRARAPIAREDWPRLLTLSLLWVAVPFTLFPIAQQYINSAITGMLCGAVPLFSAPVQALMLKKLPRTAMVLGVLVGFGGVVLVSLPSVTAESEDKTQATGVALVLLATLCYGVSVNIATPIQQKYGSLPVMVRMLGLGLPDSRFEWGPFSAVMVAGTAGTGIAYVLMGELVGRAGSTRASFITYIIPVVALALGVIVKDDEVEALHVVGVGLIIAGALLASRKES